MKIYIKSLFCILFIHLWINSSFAQVSRIGPVGITVSNLHRAVGFYEQFGFKKISESDIKGSSYEKLEGIYGLHAKTTRMQLGDEYIDLTDYLTSGGRNIPDNARSNDLIFQHIAIVVSDMDKAFHLLRKNMVEYVSTEPQTLPANNLAAAGIKAFYFHDPDMHNIELIYFPKGKGQSKWQRKHGKLFLGIDHTAIGIQNTDSSLLFYQDLLGISRKGESWNMGMEQARLNFVEGASLHITGLRAPSGPGIEFLQYLEPGPGKPYPSDTRADDIWYWQTTLEVDHLDSLYQIFKSKGYAFVSKEIISIRTSQGMHSKAFIVRDPDGHAMLVKESPEDYAVRVSRKPGE